MRKEWKKQSEREREKIERDRGKIERKRENR
jgi:hypothetical protein